MPESEDKPESQARAVAFERRLQELGWMPGRNLQIDYRWGMGGDHGDPLANQFVRQRWQSIALRQKYPATLRLDPFSLQALP